MSTLTCQAPGCTSAGKPIRLDLTYVDLDTGLTQTVDLANVICGACGEQITDITDDAGV